MVYKNQPLHRVGPLSSGTLSGVVENTKGLRRVDDILEKNSDAEFMYLRDNEIRKFAPGKNLEKLRVLDLSMNNIGPKIDFLSFLPRIHHIYLSVNKIETLEGFSGLVGLETLCVSDNAITSFQGLSNLPNLRVLSLNFNAIETFEHYPTLPNLHTLNLVGNPIATKSFYRSMAIAINNNHLVSIDGTSINDEARADVEHYQGKIVYCIRNGFVVENDEDIEEAADEFVKTHHHTAGLDGNDLVHLSTIRISSGKGSDRAVKEGKKITLSVCLQDKRPVEERRNNFFSSPHLIPTVFSITGTASSVSVMGSFNNWSAPLVLQEVPPTDEEDEENPEPTFETLLYLPEGEYDYRFLVDGEERLDGTACFEGENGSFNRRVVTAPEPTEEEKVTIFHIRWMRQGPSGVFELVPCEHALEYVPTKEDIGCCLRAELLAYVNGQFSFLFFDISSPVLPAPPQCTRLEIKGEARENQILLVEADYFGGEEGTSSLAWSRIKPSGEEVPIHLANPFAGFKVTRECIGCTIKATFTPVRNDWVPGEPKSAETDTVTEGNPECQSIEITGELKEGSTLHANVVYSGGVEGVSQYQWLRNTQGHLYAAIPGETKTTYTPTHEDVGKSLAVEYIPVNSKGKEGQPCRCVLDNLIAPASPEIRNISIYGTLKENEQLILKYTYVGGMAGKHLINWFSRRPGAKKPVKIGTSNSTTLTLSSEEVGSFIEVTMTPVRSDKVQGATVLAKTASCVTAAPSASERVDDDAE